mmetsp:Transcript_2753/g.5817  ORF Transcript_2753/g.5817 Transcript_2753/m.5817 type:complete len:231 (+) Transcript_2753:1065-1757(+)
MVVDFGHLRNVLVVSAFFGIIIIVSRRWLHGFGPRHQSHGQQLILSCFLVLCCLRHCRRVMIIVVLVRPFESRCNIFVHRYLLLLFLLWVGWCIAGRILCRFCCWYCFICHLGVLLTLLLGSSNPLGPHGQGCCHEISFLSGERFITGLRPFGHFGVTQVGFNGIFIDIFCTVGHVAHRRRLVGNIMIVIIIIVISFFERRRSHFGDPGQHLCGEFWWQPHCFRFLRNDE